MLRQVMVSQLHRIKSLDGARGIAALLVVIDHYIINFAMPNGSVSYYLATFLGSYAVGLFFITSGFVVAASATTSTTADFFLKRIFRLYPIVLTAGALRLGAEYLTGNPRELDFNNFLLTISLFGSYIVPNEALVEPIFWTLAIEIKFYLLIGLSYFVARRFKIDIYFLVTLVILSFGIGVNYIIPLIPKHQWAVQLGVVASTMPMLIVGWSFWLFYSNKISISKFAVSIAGVLLLFSIAPFPIYISLYKGMPSWILAFITFFCLLYFPKYSAFLSHQKFQFFGKISYVMYACHMPIVILFVYYLPPPHTLVQIPTVLVFITFVIILAYAAHRLIEAPMIVYA